MRKLHFVTDGPSAAELAAIDTEMPLIEAQLDLLDAEISHLYAEDRGGPSPMDWRRLRRAEARVTRVATELAARPTTRTAPRARRVDTMPDRVDLAAITAEWPDIAAELSDRPVNGRAVA